MNAISVIVPTLNEAESVPVLVKRLAASFAVSGIDYEVVFVDDNSTDGTPDVIKSLMANYPVRYLKKQGPRGKAYSLLEGFAAADNEILCMIDADLQYPPEAIVPMYSLMSSTNTDVVLTNRQDHATSRLRKISSAGFNFVFTKMLFGFDYDSQSGLKLFKRDVIRNISLSPTPWSFDLEFIVRALELDYKIVSYDISFAQRYAGEAKIQVSKVAIELAKASLKLRFSSSPTKVKRAYRNSNRLAEKAMMVGLLAFMSIGGLSWALTGHSYSLPFASPASVFMQDVSPAITTLAVATPNDNTGDNNNKNDNGKNSEDLRVSIAAAPMLQSGDETAPSQTSGYTATQSNTPDQTANLQPARPVETTASVSPPSTVSPAGAAPQVLGTSIEPLPNRNQAVTYPNETLQFPTFTYSNRRPSQAVNYIKPLALIAGALIVLGLSAYVALRGGELVRVTGALNGAAKT